MPGSVAPTASIPNIDASKVEAFIRQKIEEELDYPSTIKITVIREQRYTETAT